MIELTLPTMTCGHCVRTVTATVQKLDPEAKVSTDLATHRVAIDTRLAAEQVTQALIDEGYAPA